MAATTTRYTFQLCRWSLLTALDGLGSGKHRTIEENETAKFKQYQGVF